MGLAFRFGLLRLVGAHDRVAILSMIRRDGGRGGGRRRAGVSALLVCLGVCVCALVLGIGGLVRWV